MIHNVDLIAPTFDGRRSASEYSLSIRQMPDGYSFSITDNDQQCQAIKFICCNERNAAKELKDEPLLLQQYKSVKYFQLGIVSIIPSNNNKNRLPAIIQPLYNTAGDVLRHKTTDFVIDKINENISCCFIKKLPTFDLNTFTSHHYLQLIIELALNSTQASGIWIEHTDYFTSITIKINNKILLANSYSTNTAVDAIYYIMLCYDNLKISQKETPVFLIDSSNNHDTALNVLLSSYIKNIELLSPSLWNEIPQYLKNNKVLNIFTLQTSLDNNKINI